MYSSNGVGHTEQTPGDPVLHKPPSGQVAIADHFQTPACDK